MVLKILLSVKNEVSQTIVIPDINGKKNLMLWGGIFLFTLIIYLALGLILDIRRDIKIEQIKAEDELNKREEKTKKKDKVDVIPYWLQNELRVLFPCVVWYVICTRVIVIGTNLSGSMEPKLIIGKTVIYNRLAYVKAEPQRGDIIAFHSDEFNLEFVKRVIGIPGDTIEFHNGFVYINGCKADESAYISENVETNSPKTFTVPDNCVFVLGDNRENSHDARYWENPYISYNAIEGRYIGQLHFKIPFIAK